MNQELKHFGILGMRWGVRRYQNKDGSLTPLGRKHVGLDKYEDRLGDDYVIKKGTKGTRVLKADTYEKMIENDVDFTDPNYKKIHSKYFKEAKDEMDKIENNLSEKYVSIDDVRNSTRARGADFYVGFKSDHGYEIDDVYIDHYTVKNDVKIASAKKVLDEILKSNGPINKDTKIDSLLYDYKRSGRIDQINESLKKQGYGGVEDLYDNDTDMPIVFFDTKNQLIKTKSETGEEYLKRRGIW